MDSAGLINKVTRCDSDRFDRQRGADGRRVDTARAADVLRRLHPDVYAPKRAELTLEDRISAAWLWSRRRGVICGLAAAALHGAKWVDSDVPIEMVSPNHRAPAGVITRNSTLSDDEVANRGSMQLTTVERTAFDLALSGRVRKAVAYLDALAAATHYKDEDVRELARRHPRLRDPASRWSS